jgi:large subunit ribosomal protein L24
MLKGRENEQFKSRLRLGDTVLVIAGNDRGKVGKIVGRKSSGFIVEGVNVRKRHMRQQRQGNQTQGGIIEMETPIHPCKLKPCTAEGRGIRLKMREGAQGKRELVYEESGKQVVYRTVGERSTEK